MSEYQEVQDDTLPSLGSTFVPRLVSSRDVLLYAREALEGDRPELAFAALDQVALGLQDDELLEAAVLRGAALVALGRLDDGIALLQPAVNSGNERLRTEAACELARAYLRAGRLDSAEATLSPFLGATGAGEPHLAAQVLALYGRAERARGRRTVAARYYLDAFVALDRAREPFPSLRNALLRDIALIAVETLEPRLFERVREPLAAVDGMHPHYGALQRARVAGELLCGNVTSAWDAAFSATRSRRGVQYVAALVDLAAVSAVAGDAFSAERIMLAAAESAKFVDWERADTGERRALLRLAAALAPAEPNRAAALLRLYQGLPSSVRRSGDAATAHALARAALFGARKRSSQQVEALARAAKLARDDGDHHGEAEALLALAAAGGDDQALRRADELTGLVPRSWLRRRYEALVRSSGIARLSPAQRRVMNAICEGFSTEDIAARFGRSKNTIRNQTRRVYEQMGVHTRSALVAKCAAAGLLRSAADDRSGNARPS